MDGVARIIKGRGCKSSVGIQSVSDGNEYVVVLDWKKEEEEDKEKEGEERNALEATTVETKPDTRLSK